MRHARVYELLLGQTSEYDLDHILCFSDAFCTDPKYDVEVALQWQDALQYLSCAKPCQINVVTNKSGNIKIIIENSEAGMIRS
jgi:hypothetical protein